MIPYNNVQNRTYNGFYRNISGVNLSGKFAYRLIRVLVGMRIHITPCTCTACAACARRGDPHCRCEQRRGHCNVTKTEFIILTRGPVVRNFDRTLDRASQHSLYRSANRVKSRKKVTLTHSLSSASLKFPKNKTQPRKPNAGGF